MKDILDVEKTGFDGCYARLEALSASLSGLSVSLDAGSDTSMTGKRAMQCMKALLQVRDDLVSLAEETAKDVRLTQARYELSDK